ncbi:SET and MYND domain-containing protein 4 isoform X1 [Pelmatolapia mariae]|uniref:SET and MYND domain-containing protein 4 isoform X1 n=1 Tax=Pelmatolapia mariae TaxID=158779 RepID=UPI002FE677C9
MDLLCVQWQDHVAQKWRSLEPKQNEQFTSLLEIDGVFRCALSLMRQDDLDFLQQVSAVYSVQKDAELAAKCRERGNSSFKTKNYTAAALHYSKGICFAPSTSEQLSLCYANRSAALYHLQHYRECLDDIDRAVKNGYPSHLLHKLEDRCTLCFKHLSVHEKGRENDQKPASNDCKGSDTANSPSVGPLTVGICPQVVVDSTVEKGRHLVAVNRIAAGEVILTDRPYSCVLLPGMEEVKGKVGRYGREREVLFGIEDRRCHRCLTETLSLVPCDGCSYSRYCSTGCQQEAWEEHHRWECALGADLMAMGVMSQLALRVALKAGLKNFLLAREPIRDEHKECFNNHSSDPSTSSYGGSYLNMYNLLHHLNHHSPALRFMCAVTAATLYLKLSKAGPPPVSWSHTPQGPNKEGEDTDWNAELWMLGSAVLQHILQLRCNAQAIVVLQDTGATNSPVQSNREIRIATAVFPTLSLLNHSCCPNTSLVFSTGGIIEPSGSALSADFSGGEAEWRHNAQGVTVTVRAARLITPGQEILHCYGPHSSRMVTQERRRLLQEQYYFLCQCEACSQQQQDVEEPRQQQPGAEGRDLGLLCIKCKGSLKKRSEDREAGFVCSRSSCSHCMSLSDVNNRLQEIRVNLEKAVELMETDRPGEALRLLKKTLCQSGLILAETHPLQGELADATARAYASMGDWNNAASHLERSAVAIASQFGKESVELGRQLFKLAQLHFNGGSRGTALSVIPKVRRLLCLHCGPHCHELQELKAMEDCLQG